MSDLKFACRQLLKNPGCNAVDLRTLALKVGLGSNQTFEFTRSETGVSGNLSHGESIDRVVAGNHDDSHSIAHDGVFAFAEDLEARLFQGANRDPVVYARKFGHGRLDRDGFAGHGGSKAGGQFGACFQIFPDGVANVLQRFFPRSTLTAATGQFIAPDGKTFIGFDQSHRVIHGRRIYFNCRLSSLRPILA